MIRAINSLCALLLQRRSNSLHIDCLFSREADLSMYSHCAFFSTASAFFSAASAFFSAASAFFSAAFAFLAAFCRALLAAFAAAFSAAFSSTFSSALHSCSNCSSLPFASISPCLFFDSSSCLNCACFVLASPLLTIL
ncbi:MAG: hypothetical protein S4CHLAM27_09860 [Chlamydiia bacterium]|nr:hypothetical protein [Chlamydiia bacterium]